MQIAACLTSLFSSLLRYITGKPSSFAKWNPWVSGLLLQHLSKVGVCYSSDCVLKRYQPIVLGDYLGQSSLPSPGTVLSSATLKASRSLVPL